MPVNERIPALVWEDGNGHFTAGLIADWDNATAHGESRRDVLQQLKDFLDWHQDEYGFVEGGDLTDVKLSVERVDVRPEYIQGDRVFPCEETVRLRVPCVHGKEESGMLLCAIPTLNIRFNFHDPGGLKGLVTHFVNNALKGSTPATLARRLPPEGAEIQHIVYRAKNAVDREQAKPWFERDEFKNLRAVAEPFLTGRGRTNRFGAAWGRGPEVWRLAKQLGQEKANVILLGPPGGGKTTLLADTVSKLSSEAVEDVDASLRRYRFWLTNAARLIAGARYLGQWESRCEELIDELSDVSGALCVENMLDLVNTGGQGAGDSLAAFMLPYLQRNELQLVVEATPAELDACRRLMPGFVDVFQILRLDEFDQKNALSILDKVIEAKERQSGVTAEFGVGATVYRLFHRFMPYAAFPGQAVAFLRDAFEKCSEDKETLLKLDRLLRQFVDHTGLPEMFLRDDLLLEQAEVQKQFEAKIIGQPDACRQAANVITTFKAGMNDPTRPLAALLFCGPTGVGKTALARAMANTLYGGGGFATGLFAGGSSLADAGSAMRSDSASSNEDRLVRLDMSEYAAPGSAARLLMANDGGPSAFIKQLRRQPFVVVLLDEIEKAAPEVFDVFLSVFDEGRITDRLGRETILRSAVIVMTSNLGAGRAGSLGFGPQSAPSYDDEALSFFRPEFYNRIDSVVAFHPLENDSIHRITEKELRDLSQREGFVKAHLRLSWSDALVAHLAEAGFDLKLGARPLQRAIEQELIAPLAKFLVENSGLKDAEIGLDWDESAGVSIVANAV